MRLRNNLAGMVQAQAAFCSASKMAVDGLSPPSLAGFKRGGMHMPFGQSIADAHIHGGGRLLNATHSH